MTLIIIEKGHIEGVTGRARSVQEQTIKLGRCWFLVTVNLWWSRILIRSVLNECFHFCFTRKSENWISLQCDEHCRGVHRYRRHQFHPHCYEAFWRFADIWGVTSVICLNCARGSTSIQINQIAIITCLWTTKLTITALIQVSTSWQRSSLTNEPTFNLAWWWTAIARV